MTHFTRLPSRRSSSVATSAPPLSWQDCLCGTGRLMGTNALAVVRLVDESLYRCVYGLDDRSRCTVSSALELFLSLIMSSHSSCCHFDLQPSIFWAFQLTKSPQKSSRDRVGSWENRKRPEFMTIIYRYLFREVPDTVLPRYKNYL